MRSVDCLFSLIIFLVIGLYTTAGAINEITIESIKDSSALLKKIKSPGEPLYKYFADGKRPETRADIIAIINKRVIPNADFAFEATQIAELKITEKFENLNSEKQEEVMVKNCNLLSELYPDEIASPPLKSVKQGFEIKIDSKKLDSTLWLKAEIVNFLNEIICNANILMNTKAMRNFFDNKVTDTEIEEFAEYMRAYTNLKIPINTICIQQRNSHNVVDVMLREKRSRLQRNMFTVSIDSRKAWKITEIKNIANVLKKAGYLITNKEVRK